MKWAESAFTSAIIYKVSKLMYTGSPCVILYEKPFSRIVIVSEKRFFSYQLSQPNSRIRASMGV